MEAEKQKARPERNIIMTGTIHIWHNTLLHDTIGENGPV
jgi:hypothetical protein